MFEKEAEEWAMDNVCKDCSRYEKCMGKEHCTCKDCSKEKWQNGAEFGFQKGIKAKIESLSKSLYLAKGIIRDLIDDTVDFKESKERAVYCYEHGSFDGYREAVPFLKEQENDR